MPVLIPQLALASDRQNKHCIETFYETIKRDMAGRSPADHQFAFTSLDGSANQRAVGKDLDRLHNFDYPAGRIRDLKPSHVGEKAIKVLEDFRGEFDAGHPAR